MCVIVGKFYAFAVEDLKPLVWEDLAESVDPDELIYLVGCEGKDVILADVSVCDNPETREAA